MYLNPTRSNLNSLHSTYRITYENVGNQVEYLFTCIHPKCTTIWHTCESAGEGVGHLEQLVPFRPHRELLGPYFILLETSPNDVVAMFECYPRFPCYFVFASPANVCHINGIKRGAGDRKPWSWVLKLSSLFGRHMIRITGNRNPDTGAVGAKICTTGCQAPQLVTAVWNPNKDAGLAKRRREQSCRRAFCALS